MTQSLFSSYRETQLKQIDAVKVCARHSSRDAHSKGREEWFESRFRCVWCTWFINFVLQQTGEIPHCAFGSSLVWHDSQAEPQVTAKMKISGGKYLDENLKASQPAEWQPVHACFLRFWTGSYYWCLLLGAAHTDELNVVNLLGAPHRDASISYAGVSSFIYGRVLDRMWQNEKTVRESAKHSLCYSWTSTTAPQE